MKQITRKDMIALVHTFLPSQSIQGTKTAKSLTLQAIKILKDMETYQILTLNKQELELMVRLSVSVDQFGVAQNIACRLEALGPLSDVVREQLAIAMARCRRFEDCETLCSRIPNLNVCAEQVNRMLLEKDIPRAKATLEKHQLTSLDRDTLDHGLDQLIIHCIRERRDSMMGIELFKRKRELGFSGSLVARLLADRCMYTMQPKMAWQLLEIAQATNDIKSIQGIANGMTKQYLAQRNLNHAMDVYMSTRLKTKRRSPLPMGTRRDLMVALARTSRVADTLLVFKDIHHTTPYRFTNSTYHSLLRGLIDAYADDDVRFVYKRLQRRGIIPNLDTFHVLMTFCGRSGDTEFAKTVVQDMASRGLSMTHKMYTSLMACYVKAHNPRSAIAVFQTFVQQSGEKPDIYDFNILLRTTVSPGISADDTNTKIVAILEHMKRVQVMPNDVTMLTLLQIYDEVAPNQAETLWQRIVDTGMLPSVRPVRTSNVMYTRMIEKEGILTAGYHFFDKQKGAAQVPVNGITYKLFLDAATISPATMGLANKFYKDMRARGIKPPQSVYEKMISGWSRKWQISKAKRVMQDMEHDLHVKAGLIAWTRLTDGFIARKQTTDLHKLVMEEMMEQHGIVPDTFLEDRVVKALKEQNMQKELDQFVKALQLARQERQRKSLAKTKAPSRRHINEARHTRRRQGLR
ncbi:hypothetical protein INT43_004348 [Umbelopsis isabellina]|uniref:PROP1-like PPR domain-containing protein n=1 Tax=Mortierella isabellina TaxID=91625 RepID=A0A8H7PIE7_MORIS|nr:hypothetical protein INT43_004348 [Umbelopsis isabellina]